MGDLGPRANRLVNLLEARRINRCPASVYREDRAEVTLVGLRSRVLFAKPFVAFWLNTTESLFSVAGGDWSRGKTSFIARVTNSDELGVPRLIAETTKMIFILGSICCTENE